MSTGSPVTEERLRQDLRAIGVVPGSTVMVHSSLKAIGWVLGGAPTVIRALLGVIGDEGNLAMPAATPDCTDPAGWRNPPVPQAWLEEVRNHLPVFDIRTTPTTMGAIPEAFRTWPGTVRSNHPLESVCVRGPDAVALTRDHPLAFSEGPFARLYDLDSLVLLLGVGFNRCTALHFAESLVPNRRTTTLRFARLQAGRKIWDEIPNVADDNDTHFPIIGARYIQSRKPAQRLIGEAHATCFRMRDLVAFARAYFAGVLPVPQA